MFSYCDDLQEKMTQVINESPLSIDIKFFIIKDLYRTIHEAYVGYLNQPEQKQENKSKTFAETEEVEIPLENIEMNDDMKDIIKKGIAVKEKEMAEQMKQDFFEKNKTKENKE